VDLDLTDAQRALRDQARELSLRELAPQAGETDRQQCFPRAAIASLGEVYSVLLAHKQPLAKAKEIFCDPASLASVNLLKVLLAERGLKPEFKPMPDPARAAEHDAFLLIGDPAIDFQRAPHEHEIFDLGAAWYELTKLPFVFAVWALRRGIENKELRQELKAARRFGLETLDYVIETLTQSPVHGPSYAELKKQYTPPLMPDYGDPGWFQSFELGYQGYSEFLIYWDQDEDTTGVDHFYLETSKMNINHRFYTALIGPHQPMYLTGPKYGPNYHEWMLKIKNEFDPLWVCHPPVPFAHDEFVDRAPWMHELKTWEGPKESPYPEWLQKQLAKETADFQKEYKAAKK